jgi:hypothetical protein
MGSMADLPGPDEWPRAPQMRPWSSTLAEAAPEANVSNCPVRGSAAGACGQARDRVGPAIAADINDPIMNGRCGR